MLETRLFKPAVSYTARALALAVSLAVVPVALDQVGINIGAAQAQEAEKPKPRETRKTPALRNKVYEKLQKIQEAAEAKDFATAVKLLEEMRTDDGKNQLNSYELANMWNFYAFVYYSQENYPKTIQAYRNVLKQPDLPLAMEINTQYQIAQLYFVVEDYPKAIVALNDWFKVAENPQPNAYILRSQAYYQVKKYDNALSDVEKAMSLAEAKGKEPKENWYLLMRALYYEKGDMNKVGWVLEELLRRWPKKDYLTQISGIYAEQKKEGRQLAAYEAAYNVYGFEREQEVVNMSYLFLGADVPYKAAQAMEKGFKEGKLKENTKNYELLGNALSAAQESKRALPYMEKAAKLADNGEPWARLANIYFDNDKYDDAVKAGRTALKKGKVKRPDNTMVVIGMSLFNLERLNEARREFVKAGKDKRSEKLASQWVRYIDNEIVRRKSLADDLS